MEAMSVFDAVKKLFAPDLVKNQPVEWLIVGLGNPGGRYALTRHNVGYRGVDRLLAGKTLEKLSGMPALGARMDLPVSAEGHGGNDPSLKGAIMVLRSTTFMNLSGEAVGAVASKWNVPAERIIVLHDELDLPAGTVRLKKGGNENGHNGLKSISEHLGTRDYVRVRMGIGRPPKGTAVPDYVLGQPEEDLTAMIALAAKAALLIVTDGLTKAQNTIHSR